jgi:hypothetical protein
MATQTELHDSHLDPDKPHALEGITVIDFTHVLAGPTCTRMLADAGARVIKIERPKIGDDTRLMGPFTKDGPSEYYRFANLGKESIALDLKNPDDLALVRTMIAHADVVVENLRPGVVHALGLDPTDLVAAHPRLVVCSISGFGHNFSGLMDATGWPDGPPTRTDQSARDGQERRRRRRSWNAAQNRQLQFARHANSGADTRWSRRREPRRIRRQAMSAEESKPCRSSA